MDNFENNLREYLVFYWSVYERLKLYIMRTYQTSPTLSAFYSGATAGKIWDMETRMFWMRISGAIATILTHPFDTIKSIRQSQLGNPQSQTTNQTIPILQKMLREQGLRSWYKGNWPMIISLVSTFLCLGLVPRLLKVSPACAVMISTIEFFRENVFK